MKRNLLLSGLLLASLVGCGSNTNSSSTTNKESSKLTTSSEVSSSSSKVSSSSSSKIENNDIDIIVLCGQSNAEGNTWNEYLFSKAEKDKAKKYLNGFKDVNIMFNCANKRNYSNDFVPVKAGQGLTVNHFGPEVGIAETITENLDKVENPVYIIKYAVGATSLNVDWLPSSASPNGQAGKLFFGLMDYFDVAFNNLIDAGYNPKPKALCWMQGEADSCNTNWTNTYGDYIDLFMSELNDFFMSYSENEEEVCFVDAGISDCSTWVNYQKVNEAKKANAEKDSDHRFYIDTIAEGLEYHSEPIANPDLYHYDALSMIKLGNLFAETLINNNII